MLHTHPADHQAKAVPRRPSQGAGAAAPQLAPFDPSFCRLQLTVLPSISAEGCPGSLHVEVSLVPSMWGGSIFQRAPSSPPIKGGSLSPHSNNTQEHKSITKQEQEHLHSMGIGPS
jgi:hypothetical protein